MIRELIITDKDIRGKYRNHEYSQQKLERPIAVRNIDGTNNSGEAIIHQVEVNMYYKGYVERMRIDVYNLGKTEVILGMPWLQAHNPEINWETRDVKMMKCLPLCGRAVLKKEEKKVKKGKRMVILEKERMVRWAIDDKED